MSEKPTYEELEQRAKEVEKPEDKYKRLEEALREAEQKWQNILVKIPQIGIALDPQAAIVFANTHFLELTGWKAEDIIGRNWFDLLIPEDVREEVRGVFQEVINSRDTLGYSTYENEILTKTGDRRNVAWANVITKAVSGAVVSVTCLGVDLTERKQAESKLKESEEKYRLLVENANELVLVAQDGLIRFVNRKAIDFTGYTPEELEGKQFIDYIHPEERKTVADRHLKRMKGEDLPGSYPFRILYRGGGVQVG